MPVVFLELFFGAIDMIKEFLPDGYIWLVLPIVGPGGGSAKRESTGVNPGLLVGHDVS